MRLSIVLAFICTFSGAQNGRGSGRGGRGGLDDSDAPPSPPSPPASPVPPIFSDVVTPGTPSANSISTPTVGRCSEGASNVRSFDLDEINSLIFRLQVRTRDTVDAWVEYEADIQFSSTDSSADSTSIDSEDVPRLRSPTQSGTEFEFYFVRLLELTRYEFEMYTSEDCAALIGFFVTGEVPDEVRDRRPTLVEGSATYDLVLQVHKPFWYIFDNLGNIVWWIEEEGISNEGAFLVKEEDHHIVFQLDAEERQSDGGVKEFSPVGDFAREYEADCEVLHHGFDFALERSGALSQRRFTSVSKKRHDVNGSGIIHDMASDTIGHMDIETGEWVEYFDMIDYVDPRDTSTSTGEQYRFVATQFLSCDTRGDVVDYLHVNSVHEYEPGKIILSARNVHTIYNFVETANGWEMEWALGADDDTSDFAFEDENDKFYGQHAVRVLENGNVILFDNGGGRPRSEGGEFSRAMELRLNTTNGTVEKVWEFELRLTEGMDPCMARHRGEIFEEENGNKVVFFPSCDNDRTRGAYYAEVDRHGNRISLMREDLDESGTPFLQDFFLVSSIYGEFSIE